MPPSSNPKTVLVRVVKTGIPGFAPGREVLLDVDEEGTPLSYEWRRRLRAAELDGSLEIVGRKAPKQRATSVFEEGESPGSE